MEPFDLEIASLPIGSWREYKALRLRALQKEPQAFGERFASASADTDAKWQQRLQRAIDGLDWLLFARLGGKLVGMTGAFQDEEERRSRRAHIYGMYVEADARAHGIGRALITRLIADLKEKSVLVARLDVSADQEPAKGLYESLGFKIIGAEARALGDGQEHLLLAMELVIK